MFDLTKARLGMTVDEMKLEFGEPDDYNRGTRKYPKPMIYKYNPHRIIRSNSETQISVSILQSQCV